MLKTNEQISPETRRGSDQLAKRSGAKQKKGVKKRRSIKWIAAGALLLLIIAGLRPKPIPVEIAQIARGPLAVSVFEEGKTKIRDRYLISPSVSGYMDRITLLPGDRVEAGKTVLATIHAEASSLLSNRAQTEAEAHVKAAEATLQQRQADLERARSAAYFAHREEDRERPLHQSGAISAKDWDDAEMTAAIRDRELQAAESSIQVANYNLEQARASLLQAKGETGSDDKTIEIKSPATGQVLTVNEPSARSITAGTPIMEVGDTRDLEAEIELLSTDAAMISPGAEAIVERWGGPYPLHAKVREIEPAAFTKTSALGVEEQRVKVIVEFTDPLERRAALGDRYRVEARIITWKSDNTLQAPTGALFRRGHDWMCYVLKGGKAVLRQVEIDHNNGVSAEVKSGLEPGEQVIVHPPDVVTEGASVQARK